MHKFHPRSSGVSLADILPKSHFFGGGPVRVTACCDVAELCQPGDLFAAITRDDGDGHDDADRAVRRGAVAILAERPLPFNIPTCVVHDSRAAFGTVCQALAGNPSAALQTVGVAGTFGKTVVSTLVAAILEADRHQVGLLNSLGTCDGAEIRAPLPRTLAVPEVANWLAATRDNGCSHAVMETSSIALAQRRLAGVQFDVAVMNPLRRAHLHVHGSVLNYRRAEERLLTHLKRDGVLVRNADDPTSALLTTKCQNPILSHGMNQPADVAGEIWECHHGEQTLLISFEQVTIPVTTRVIGAAHAANCLAATAAALALGVSLETIAEGLESVTQVPGRMEPCRLGGEVPIYLDTVVTPDSLASALVSLRKVTRGRVICLLGVPTDQDPGERPLFGRTMERLSDVAVLTAANRGAKLPLNVAHDVLDGADRPAVMELMPDRDRALRWCLNEARPGDTILALGRNLENHVGPSLPVVYDEDREFISEYSQGRVACPPARRRAA